MEEKNGGSRSFYGTARRIVRLHGLGANSTAEKEDSGRDSSPAREERYEEEKRRFIRGVSDCFAVRMRVVLFPEDVRQCPALRGYGRRPADDVDHGTLVSRFPGPVFRDRSGDFLSGSQYAGIF